MGKIKKLGATAFIGVVVVGAGTFALGTTSLGATALSRLDALGLGGGPSHLPTPAAQQVALDLDGDGSLDAAGLDPAGPERQRLRFTADGETTEALLPTDEDTGVQPLKVVNLDGDGAQEVLVTTSLGANTTTYLRVDLAPDHEVRTMTWQDGKPAELYEGGGASAVSGYECRDSGGQRRLITVDGTDDTGNMVYNGERATFRVQDGVAVKEHAQPFSGAPENDPVLQAAPATCA